MSNLVLRVINSNITGVPTGNLIPAIQFDAANIQEYENYNFHQNFMQPADEFTFKIGAERIDEKVKPYLQNNAQVFLNIETEEGDSRLIFTGFIDQVEPFNSRGGTVIEIRGRSNLANAIDDGIDPWSKTFEFVEGVTFGQMMSKIFIQYGYDTIYTSDVWARDIVTGVNYTNGLSHKETTEIKVTVDETDAYNEGFLEGPPQSSTTETTQTVTVWVDPTRPVDLEQLKLKKCKPRHDETAYHFAELHAKRFHLHIWGTPDGSGVIIGTPDYLQDPLFKFYNTYDGVQNNILESRLEVDSCHMPAAIIAKGEQGGGDLPSSTVKCVKVNEFLGYKPGAYQAFPSNSSASRTSFNENYIKPTVLSRINRYKNLPVVDPIPALLLYQDSHSFFNTRDVKTAVIYWEDKTSKTQAQLESAVQRRMSEFMRTALRLHLRIQGHDQNGMVYRYNTIATITDEKLGLNNLPFWIEDVVFRRSRQEGTVTELTLIPLQVLSF